MRREQTLDERRGSGSSPLITDDLHDWEKPNQSLAAAVSSFCPEFIWECLFVLPSLYCPF